jgi:dipeptidyl aminopeptidase/acylaminoacyl peptidase
MPSGPTLRASRRLAVLCLVLTVSTFVDATSQAARRMDFHQLMRVRKIVQASISENGDWVGYVLRPDRGDGAALVVDRRGHHEQRVDGASAVELSADGSFASFVVGPSFEERETLDKDELPDDTAVLLRTRDGQQWRFEGVESSAFTKDGAWWARLLVKPDAAASDSTRQAESDSTKKAERVVGSELVLRRLADGREWSVSSVSRYAFDPTSQSLAVALATETGEENSLQLWSLDENPRPTTVHAHDRAAYPALRWARDLPRLAFVVGEEEEPGEIEDLRLHAYVGQDRELASGADLPPGMEVAEKNSLTWSLDGRRLFFGMLPAESDSSRQTGDPAAADSTTSFDPYDFDSILADRGVDVWHWRDPRIKPHEKKSYEERHEAQRLAVVHLDSGEVVALADDAIPTIQPELEAPRLLASTEVPYLRQETWGWFYRDRYLVDLKTGERRLVVERSSDTVSLSPDGEFVVFYRDGQWYGLPAEGGDPTSLTAGLEVPFANEDHDYPFPTPGYGVGGWIRGTGRVLVYDKYDIWSLGLDQPAICLTGGTGREEHLRYRVIDTDDEREGFEKGAKLLLSAFDEDDKSSWFYEVSTDGSGLRRLFGGDRRLRFRTKAPEADRILFTDEDFDRFPDLWTANLELEDRQRVSDANPELGDFELGTSELVEWQSLDGIPTQGVLIKPPDYDAKRRYPVLVYFYRFFSQHLHDFNDPVINHRPSFYVYAGDDYCIFLPDIRFEIGRPGLAATKSLVPGVQMLVERGIADPDAVALHGHSWSGYQTAQIITQTDLFACAVAGAPVSNMTSAYGGIRWESGRSRQFQYEMGQSRIGATLWNGLQRYIDNSPVFFADRIHTPLLIEFGDEDGAVPWTQGIELYMAMRRLDRPCVMLEYRGEPHHLQKYPNKLDYSLKMKAFIDHFCKGAPAPEWWTEGVPYTGN